MIPKFQVLNSLWFYQITKGQSAFKILQKLITVIKVLKVQFIPTEGNIYTEYTITHHSAEMFLC